MGASQPFQVFLAFKPSQTLNVNSNSQFIQPSLENFKINLTSKPSQALNVEINLNSKFTIPRKPKSDETIVSEISLIKRPAKYFLKHSALFVVSICEQNGQPMKEFHIIEFMDDSRVHLEQIEMFQKTENYFKINKADWKIEEFYHDVELKKYNVKQIWEMMKQQANQKGEYNLLKNNCNKVAYEFFKHLKNKNQ